MGTIQYGRTHDKDTTMGTIQYFYFFSRAEKWVSVFFLLAVNTARHNYRIMFAILNPPLPQPSLT